ncbi:hypothetical protein N7495_000858 [Penicillium taxi]|uniref:uncharacterized protein n=1 Tax=Penicillium taxi TaxID=168475 RepID=UPI0025459DDB|nr:uncharacterized protein N7495_000858 [Penicillium taxi]KAJ5908176.1 hypothetical protein N7495_000858 [Penicillium taxi]
MTATLSMSPKAVVNSSARHSVIDSVRNCPDGTFNAAPDTPSPIYPDRLIRPLPRRTIRSRLSTDAADTIFFPPTPLHLKFSTAANDHKVYVQQTIESDRQELTPEADSHIGFETAGEAESGDEDGPVAVRRSSGFRASLSPSSSTHPTGSKDGAPKSSAGPDGYDAFENTNNKKKRKIPTPGNIGGHHSTLSPEFASMGLSSSTPTPSAGDGSATGTYYGNGNPTSPGSGISGSGRGRLGRAVPRSNSGRNPLSANAAQNAWMNSKTPTRRDVSTPGPAESPSDQGIISTAIANAATISSPTPVLSHVSMMDQENTTPTKTQFTFTCESDSSKGMAQLNSSSSYPAPNRSPTSPLGPTSHNPRGFATQGTQTSPNMSQQVPLGAQAPVAGDQTSVGRKKKRSPASAYALAARQRKMQQQYTNIHHPPRMEDIWICEFCEYESIFGHPPTALIRQYEMKDRKERKRLAEKKRLLEKAKMKGRKTKKATKGASKNGPTPHGDDRASVDHSSAAGSGSLQDEEDLGHDYEDDEPISQPPTEPLPPPPLASCNHSKVATGNTSKGSADAGASCPA